MQIIATFDKIMKEFLRDRAALFWTIAWPIMWVVIDSFVFAQGNDNAIGRVRGSITISMMTFAITIAGMANLPGSIARDRERELLKKLKSMPLPPWKDFVGRILGLATFSFLAAILVVIAGLICGASFNASLLSTLESVGFLFIILISSAGIGLLLGTFIEHVQGAIMSGVGISVITASISGLFAPYTSLPQILKKFAQIYPISSANSSIIYLLEGRYYAGYNPLSPHQIIASIILSLFLFILGAISYSKFCWGRK